MLRKHMYLTWIADSQQRVRYDYVVVALKNLEGTLKAIQLSCSIRAVREHATYGPIVLSQQACLTRFAPSSKATTAESHGGYACYA
jgi:hypothetical protein